MFTDCCSVLQEATSKKQQNGDYQLKDTSSDDMLCSTNRKMLLAAGTMNVQIISVSSSSVNVMKQ